MDKQILEILKAVEPDLWWYLFQTIVAAGLGMLIYNFIQSIVQYILFRIDKQLNLGVIVMVRGEVGEIIDFNRRWIYISTEKTMIIVNMRRWQTEKWAVVRSERRKNDT